MKQDVNQRICCFIVAFSYAESVNHQNCLHKFSYSHMSFRINKTVSFSKMIINIMLYYLVISNTSNVVILSINLSHNSKQSFLTIEHTIGTILPTQEIIRIVLSHMIADFGKILLGADFIKRFKSHFPSCFPSSSALLDVICPFYWFEQSSLYPVMSSYYFLRMMHIWFRWTDWNVGKLIISLLVTKWAL